VFLSAQNSPQIPGIDSSRKIINNPNSKPEEYFYGFRTLNRYYYTAGLFDSSDFVLKEMMKIAGRINRDTLLIDAWSELGNRYAFQTDYNPALASYLKTLEYKPVGLRKARTLNLIAYLYANTDNNELALKYLKKSDSAGSFPNINFQKYIFYSTAYNNLKKPDSAWHYMINAESIKPPRPGAALYSVLLRQFARAYELKKDFHRADSCYRNTMNFCEREMQMAGLARLAINYSNFLMSRDSFSSAQIIAIKNLAMARQYGFVEAIAQSAEILKKIYNHRRINDSAYYFSEMQIEYTDSLRNQKKIAEFQNLIFNGQLGEIEEREKTAKEEELRRQNIQYVLIALVLVLFIFFFLLLIRNIIINVRVITSLSVVALLVLFEFLNLLLHPFLEKVTHHSPLLMLLALVCIAALLIPLHHHLKKWATIKLVEKNKQVRLRKAAKLLRS
jgi:tetratricopeptide (TPR) repeat protein